MEITFKTFFFTAIVIFSSFSLSGCKTLDSKQNRLNYIEDFNSNIKKLPATKPMTLTNCLELALTNNLQLKSSQIEKNISSLDKKSAFSYLLPQIDFTFSNSNWSKDQLVKAGTDNQGNTIYTSTHDSSIDQTAFNISFPILTPSAWFMYSMRKKNVDIAKINLELTRQLISLKITSLYYSVIAKTKIKTSLESSIKAAQIRDKELKNLLAEGLITSWQKTSSETLLLKRKQELATTINSITETKAELLTEMGYSPLENLILSDQYIFKTKHLELENLIYEALVTHPFLYLKDQLIELQKDNLKIAISNFLPDILGYANLNTTTDSFVKYSSYWLSGIKGFVSLFHGFRTLTEYKKAKAKKELAYISQEEATLSIMLSVTKAYLAYQNTLDNLKVANSYLKSLSQKLTEVEHRWQEGLETTSSFYEVLYQKENALNTRIRLEILQQINIANIYNVIGKSYNKKDDNYAK